MARERDKYTQSFSNRVMPETWQAFQETVPPGFKVAHCLDAAMRMWNDLPADIRLAMLTGQMKEPLVDIVQKIVDERIQAGRDAGERLLGRQRKKPGQKD